MPLALGQTLRAKGYARRELGTRGKLRQDMRDTLGKSHPCTLTHPDSSQHLSSVLLSGDPDASMYWTQEGYYKNVYEKYGLKLVGFPQRWSLANLSDITGIARISRLAALWEDGRMHFERVSEEERRAAALNHLLAALGRTDSDSDSDDDGPGSSKNSNTAGGVHKGRPVRPDCGTQRERPVRDPHGLNRKMPKSVPIVTPEMEAEAEEEAKAEAEVSDSESSISEFSDEEERRAQRRAQLMPSDPIESEWSD